MCVHVCHIDAYICICVYLGITMRVIYDLFLGIIMRVINRYVQV